MLIVVSQVSRLLLINLWDRRDLFAFSSVCRTLWENYHTHASDVYFPTHGKFYGQNELKRICYHSAESRLLQVNEHQFWPLPG